MSILDSIFKTSRTGDRLVEQAAVRRAYRSGLEEGERRSSPWFYPVRSAAGVPVTEETGMQVAAVFASVRVLAESVASLPLKLYRRTNSGREEARGHPLWRVLHDEGNPLMTAFHLREAIMVHLCLWGNAYCELVTNSAGDVTELWPINPRRVEVKRSADSIKYRIHLDDGTYRDLPSRRVLHIPGLGFDGVEGKSPIRMAREALGISLAAERYGARFFKNDARPGITLKHPGRLSPQAHDNLKRDLAEQQAGVDNAWKPQILEEGMTIEKVGLPPGDAQFIETRKFQISEIARIFRVPPHMIGDLDRATFCLPGDTKVFTCEGPKRIDQIEAGERVWSYNGDSFESSVVTRSECTGVDEILRIEANGGVLRCNGQHRVLVRRKSLAPYTGGRGGVVRKDGKKWRWAWKEMYVRADEITTDDYLVAPHEMPQVTGDAAPTRTVDEAFCETIGHHLGDGFTLSTKGYLAGVGFSHAEDESTVEHYASALADSFQERGDFYEREAILTATVEPVRRDATTTVIYNSAAAKELEEIGLTGTAHTKRLPSWVFGLDYKYRIAVLRGYLDSDGTVSKRGQAVFCSVSRDLVDDFRHLAMSCGLVVSRISSSTTTNTFGDREHTLYRFSVGSAKDAEKIGTRRPDYAERIATALSHDKRDRSTPIQPCEARERALDKKASVRYMKVVAIERDPPELVYDLCVEGNHSFIADGLVVHNSNIEHQSLEFVMHSLRPWLVRIEQAVKRRLLTETEKADFYAEHNVDGLLRGDIQSRYQAYTSGRNWGWLSANDIRRLENMNPIPNGDEYLTPMNMLPAGTPHADDSVRSSYIVGERGPKVIIPNRKTTETRALPPRHRISRALLPMIRNVLGRANRREIAELRRAADSFLTPGNTEEFRAFLQEFQEEHVEWLMTRGQILGMFETIAGQMVEAARDEIGADVEPDEQFTRDYTQAYANRHVGSTAGQLEALLEEDDPEAAVRHRLDEWEGTGETPSRADKESDRERVRASNAFTKAAWALAGVSTIIWRNTGSSTCPMCNHLDGRAVAITQFFVREGEEVPNEGGTNIVVKRNTGHPPLHRGCDCLLMPGLGRKALTDAEYRAVTQSILNECKYDIR